MCEARAIEKKCLSSAEAVRLASPLPRAKSETPEDPADEVTEVQLRYEPSHRAPCLSRDQPAPIAVIGSPIPSWHLNYSPTLIGVLSGVKSIFLDPLNGASTAKTCNFALHPHLVGPCRMQ